MSSDRERQLEIDRLFEEALELTAGERDSFPAALRGLGDSCDPSRFRRLWALKVC